MGTHLIHNKHKCSDKTGQYVASLRLWAAYSGRPCRLPLPCHVIKPWSRGASGQRSASCRYKVTHQSSEGQQLVVLGYCDNRCSINHQPTVEGSLRLLMPHPIYIYISGGLSRRAFKIHFGNNLVEMWNDFLGILYTAIRGLLSLVAKFLIECVRPAWTELAAMGRALIIQLHLLLGSIILFFLALTPEGAS